MKNGLGLVLFRTRIGSAWWMPVLFLLATVATSLALQSGDFTYTINSGNTTVTITDYAGTGGAVVIPSTIDGKTVTSIGIGAFQSSELTSVTIPNGVTTIGKQAFSDCYYLNSVTIGNGVTTIGEQAFWGCARLTDVLIPHSVTSIGEQSFSQCMNLTSVTIGNGVTSIGDFAFIFCGTPMAIYFAGNVPSVGRQLFADDYRVTVYYLPGTTGWGTTFCGWPAMPWRPQVRTTDASFGVRTNQFGFNITWASDMVVVVEACANLANPTWSPVGTNTLTGGSSYFSDPQWTNYPARVYRLRSP